MDIEKVFERATNFRAAVAYGMSVKKAYRNETNLVSRVPCMFLSFFLPLFLFLAIFPCFAFVIYKIVMCAFNSGHCASIEAPDKLRFVAPLVTAGISFFTAFFAYYVRRYHDGSPGLHRFEMRFLGDHNPNYIYASRLEEITCGDWGNRAVFLVKALGGETIRFFNVEALSFYVRERSDNRRQSDAMSWRKTAFSRPRGEPSIAISENPGEFYIYAKCCEKTRKLIGDAIEEDMRYEISVMVLMVVFNDAGYLYKYKLLFNDSAGLNAQDVLFKGRGGGRRLVCATK